MQFKTFISSLAVIFFIVLSSIVYLQESGKELIPAFDTPPILKTIAEKSLSSGEKNVAANKVVAASGLQGESQIISDRSNYDEKHIADTMRKILQENPELIEEALQAIKAKAQAKINAQTKQRLAAMRPQLEEQAVDPRLGNGGGPLKIVQFIDYNCLFCHKMHPVIRQIIEKNRDVEIIIKHLPILGNDSLEVARISLIIYQKYPSKFADFHSFLMEQSDSKLNKSFILDNMDKFSINQAEIIAYLENSDFMRKIDASLANNIALSEDLKARGTPFFILGDRVIPGAVDYSTFQKALVAQREKTE